MSQYKVSHILLIQMSPIKNAQRWVQGVNLVLPLDVTNFPIEYLNVGHLFYISPKRYQRDIFLKTFFFTSLVMFKKQ